MSKYQVTFSITSYFWKTICVESGSEISADQEARKTLDSEMKDYPRYEIESAEVVKDE